MRYEFMVGYDKITNLAAPGYTDAEVSVLLNQAQEEFVKTTYHPLGNKYRQGYENTEKRRKDLSNLTSTANIQQYVTTTTYCHPNGRFYILPVDILYAIQEEAVISIDNECDSVTTTISLDRETGISTITVKDYTNLMRIPVKPITHDDYNYIIKSPFKKPSKTKVLRLDYNDDNNMSLRTHELITDGTYDVVRYFLRYIRKPVSIVVNRTNPLAMVDSELDSSVHREIISIAIRMATGITKPEDYQIKTIEETKTE